MWVILQNLKLLKPIRKQLRNNQTEPEKIFWNKVKSKQFKWLKFRRQHSVWKYVLDFYCPELKLCVEIDGDNHFETQWIENDKIRTEYLNQAWIKVLRFTNKEITENIEWVLESLNKLI